MYKSFPGLRSVIRWQYEESRKIHASEYSYNGSGLGRARAGRRRTFGLCGPRETFAIDGKAVGLFVGVAAQRGHFEAAFAQSVFADGFDTRLESEGACMVKDDLLNFSTQVCVLVRVIQRLGQCFLNNAATPLSQTTSQ